MEPNFYITPDNFNAIIGQGYWSIQDIPPDRAEQVRPFLNSVDALGVFASGLAPQALTNGMDVVGGIDFVRLESRRKTNEPPLNVYHYTIMKQNQYGYPVYASRNGGSIAQHWSELKDLDVYWE